jgi:hypothetical protein
MAKFVIVLTIVVFIAVVLVMLNGLFIWWDERRKVKKTPKIPFTICDTHGPYPSKFSLRISVPAENRPDLIQELCPMCYKERMEKAKVH